MSKDYLAINAGRVILTKVDPLTGALSIKPEDKRICTETCDGITRSKALNTYEIPDGNSNYPAGIYETGVAYNIGINFTTLNTATLAFLQNSKITNAAGTIKELVETMIPMEAPYEIEALGKIAGTPTVLDSESNPFAETIGNPVFGEFKVEDGIDGVRQSMSKKVTTAATLAGTVKLNIKAVGSFPLKDGKEIIVDVSSGAKEDNASEVRSVLLSDPDIVSYFEVGGTGDEVILTKRKADANESMAFNFTLGTATTFALGTTTAVAGVASSPSKVVFSQADAGKSVFIEYVFEADEVEAYDVEENHINPTVQIEIIHETLSKDKTKRYKNNSTISRAQLSGNLDENLNKQHAPTTISFTAIKPAGRNVVSNKKAEIPL